MSTRSQTSRKSGSPTYSTTSSQVPARIAEDLLRLLRGSVTSTVPTKSIVSTASVAPSTLNDGFLSKIELAILRSADPIDVSETEEITVLGQRGVWMNRSEVLNWKGNNLFSFLKNRIYLILTLTNR